MPRYNLIECSDNYLKTSVSSWQYYRDKPAIDDNGAITDFTDNNSNNSSSLFKFKAKIAARKETITQKMVK